MVFVKEPFIEIKESLSRTANFCEEEEESDLSIRSKRNSKDREDDRLDTSMYS